MTEVVESRDRKIVNEIIGKREHHCFDGILRLLVGANIHFEAIDLLKNFSAEDTPSLWVFSSQYMEKDLQQKLAAYVKQGGKLVIYPQIPVKYKHGNPCTILKDQLQLGEFEIIGGVDTVDVLEIDSVLVRQRLKFTQFEGEEIAVFTHNGGKEVASYKKSFGQGEVIVLGLGMGQEHGYQLEVIKRIAECIDVKGHLSSNNPELSLVERTNGRESFIFVGNYDEIEQKAVISENNQLLFDGEEVMIPPRSGAVFVRNYEISPDLIIDYATVELTHLHETEDIIQLAVHPIGNTGTLKLRAKGWKVNDVVHNGNEILIKDICEPKTINFKRFDSEL
jgi:beta-galactosidase